MSSKFSWGKLAAKVSGLKDWREHDGSKTWEDAGTAERLLADFLPQVREAIGQNVKMGVAEYAASGEYTSNIANIKIQTDKLIFDTDNFVKSNPQTMVTAAISTSDMDTIVDKVWNDSRTEHTSGGTMGAGIPAATMGRM